MSTSPFHSTVTSELPTDSAGNLKVTLTCLCLHNLPLHQNSFDFFFKNFWQKSFLAPQNLVKTTVTGKPTKNDPHSVLGSQQHDKKKIPRRRLADIILNRSVHVSWLTHTDFLTSLVSLLVSLSSLVKLDVDILFKSAFGNLVSVRICSVWKVQISY